MYTKPGGCVDLTSPRWHLVPAEACPHVRVCVAFKGYFVGVNYSYLSRSTFLGKCVFTFSRDLLMPELNLHIDQINISSVLRGGPVLDTRSISGFCCGHMFCAAAVASRSVAQSACCGFPFALYDLFSQVTSE